MANVITVLFEQIINKNNNTDGEQATAGVSMGKQSNHNFC